MRSANPILSRPDAFSRGGYETAEPRMTLDDVITKTTVSLGVVIVAAAAVFFLLPPALLAPVGLVSGLVAVVTSFLVAFRRRVSPALVLAFAAFEGLFVGAISKMFESLMDGAVVQAVFATFIAAAATLGAYKFFNIRVGARFRRVVSIATFAFFVVMLVNLGLSLAGVQTGLRSVDGGFNMLAVGISLLAVVLGVLNLVLDFDHIENGVRMGAPASESWKAAFGLTATLVWMYVEMLRLVVAFNRD